MTPEKAYEDLLKRMKEIALLGNTAGVLGWDQEVYMPGANAPYRAEQLSLLAGMCHQKFTDPAGGRTGSPRPNPPKALTSRHRSATARSICANGAIPMTVPPNFPRNWWRKWPGSPPTPRWNGWKPARKTSFPVSSPGWRKSSRSRRNRPNATAIRTTPTTPCWRITNRD